jgi:hypothetical protein
MPQYVPLSPSRHGGKSWRRFDTYAHAETNAVAPILLQEIFAAAAAMPLAFLRSQDAYVLAGLLSLPPGRNAFVAPHTGKWLGSYVPAIFRIYPFLFLTPPPPDKPVLCIDEQAGLLDAASGGEALFDADGKPTPALQDVAQLATIVEQNRQAIVPATAALAEAGLLVRWDLELVVDGTRRGIDGLYHVDHERLAVTEGDALVKLHQTRALDVAYAQLVSQGRVAEVQSLTAQLQSSLAASDARHLGGVESLDTVFGISSGGGTIRF